jgi:D-3-phosphoglycerate dehydrogenase
MLAADRGVEVELVSVADEDHKNLVTVRGALPDGRTVSVSGSLVSHGVSERAKLTSLDDFDLELDADGVLLFFRYSDRPGVVGTIGTILGQTGVNIAAMQVSRLQAGGEALMTLTVDSPVTAELLAEAASGIGATSASTVDLTEEV